MSVNPAVRYPANTEPPSSAYPLGSGKNSTAFGLKDGYPFEKDGINDILGHQQALLAKASIAASGNPDTALESQYLQSSMQIHGLELASVTELVADTSLLLGMTIRLGDYDPGNNSGFLFFKVVAAATGIADGGSFIDLPNTTPPLQAQQIFPKEKNEKMWGVKADGATDDTTKKQASIDANYFNKLLMAEGVSKITATLTLTDALILQGDGSYAPSDLTSGSVIDNTTNDVEAILVNGINAGSRIDRTAFRDFAIKHEAATKYAVRLDWAPFTDFDNLTIDCNSLGFGGILFGDELAAPVSQAYLGSGQRVRIVNYTGVGVRVNSTGTLWNFTNWIVGSTVDGAIGGLFNKEGVKVIGGQWGSNNVGGISLSDFNNGAGDRPGNVFEGQVFESTSNKCVSFDGDTKAVIGSQLKDAYANLISVTGVVCYFGRAKQARMEAPKITNPAGGGTLCEWGADANDCVVECDIIAAQAPIIVDPLALRAVKIITGIVKSSDVASITTDPKLTVILRDGVDLLPAGFVPVHNGTSWNYQIITLAHEAAVSFTPPTIKGLMRFINDRAANTFGIASYDVDATSECEAIAPGTQFAATTGILAGTTGVATFVTVSAHTDGKIYVENQQGNSVNGVMLLESTEFSLP